MVIHDISEPLYVRPNMHTIVQTGKVIFQKVLRKKVAFAKPEQCALLKFAEAKSV